MSRIELLNQINSIILENSLEKAINLLCDLLSNDEYITEYYDLIYILMDAFQLYGYLTTLEKKKLNVNFEKDVFEYRLGTYKGERFDYYNYGQLSLIDAIEKENKIIISAPTSFGKTSLVIEYILKNIKYLDNIIFIVPTKSLIEELYIKFLNINKEKTNNKYNVTVNILPSYTSTIRILTPEKFLSYYEHNKLNDIDLLILDEAYKIEEEETDEKEGTVVDKRALKFRKVLEIISNTNKKNILLSPYTYNKDESMKEYMNKYEVKELNRNINYVEHRYYNLSTLDEYKDYFKIGNEEKILKKNYKNISDKTFEILRKIKDSNNVIYVKASSLAIEILNKVIENNLNFIGEKSVRYEIFIRHLEDNYNIDIASEWFIITALKRGIGIYISSMPRYVKKEIINLFEQGVIKCLIVTTAFIEGVNSCAENIIITSRYVAQHIELNDMSLLNISGRAGRFGKKYIGNVFFIDNDTYKKVKNANKQGVILSNPNYQYNNTNTIRDDYELEMIDTRYLNPREEERLNAIKIELEKNNLDVTEMNNIAIGAPNEWKLLLYIHFEENADYENYIKYINQVLGEEEDKIVEGLEQIFNILKLSRIEFKRNYSEVSAFDKNGKFIWGKLYSAHASGKVKEILINKKNHITKKLQLIRNKREWDDFKKSWMGAYFNSAGEFDDNKLYEYTFKFISNIIEYKIPYYVALFINVFKFYIEKNNIILESFSEMTLTEAISKIEIMGIDEEYIEFYDYGFPKEMINKIKKYGKEILDYEIDNLEEFDEYEKVMLKEYKELMKN